MHACVKLCACVFVVSGRQTYARMIVDGFPSWQVLLVDLGLRCTHIIVCVSDAQRCHGESASQSFQPPHTVESSAGVVQCCGGEWPTLSIGAAHFTVSVKGGCKRNPLIALLSIYGSCFGSPCACSCSVPNTARGRAAPPAPAQALSSHAHRAQLWRESKLHQPGSEGKERPITLSVLMSGSILLEYPGILKVKPPLPVSHSFVNPLCLHAAQFKLLGSKSAYSLRSKKASSRETVVMSMVKQFGSRLPRPIELWCDCAAVLCLRLPCLQSGTSAGSVCRRCLDCLPVEVCARKVEARSIQQTLGTQEARTTQQSSACGMQVPGLPAWGSASRGDRRQGPPSKAHQHATGYAHTFALA
eukprot:751625-Pelagomonas_calceolata.AAC.2